MQQPMAGSTPESQDGLDGRDDLHSRNLKSTIHELQKQVGQAEAALTKLNQANATNGNAARPTPLRRLQITKTAFDEAARADPFLPFPHSVLPALLALRRTHQIIAGSQACLAAQDASLTEARRRLESGKAALSDQRALTAALEKRIAGLHAEAGRAAAVPAEQAARERTEELRREKKRYDGETVRLVRGVRKFINERLGAMVAAEDLGGPVVGNAMELGEDVLVRGFNAQGKPRRPTKKAADAEVDRDARQLRLDRIWGYGEGGGGGAQDGGPVRRRRASTAGAEGGEEASAAATELVDLIEELLNNTWSSGGDNASTYVSVERESAAARFLVRARVARFHPRDATRLRLVDFGRELDE